MSEPQRVLVICAPRRRGEVERWLEALEPAVEFIQPSDELAAHLGSDLVGLVVVTGETDSPWLEARVAAESLDDAGASWVPILEIADGPLSDRQARRCYESGASAVFRLEATSDDLGIDEPDRLVPRTLAAHLAGLPVGTADHSLARQGRIRLAVASPRLGRLRLEVSDGNVEVVGAVDSLSGRSRVERVLDSTPGIKSLDTDGIRVSTRSTDDALERRIDAAIEAAAHRSDDLRHGVRDGRVVITGSVADRHELQRIERAIERCRGAKELDSYVVVDQ